MDGKIYQAIGLMSGTSMDGIDVALIRTDGEEFVGFGEYLTIPYSAEFREELRKILGGDPKKDKSLVSKVEDSLTRLHAEAVKDLLHDTGLEASDIDVIGFHGHTINHKPDEGWTWQIGDGQLLSDLTGIDVVNDFRSKDVASGGQGAPLAPLYHKALAAELPKPVAILNLGGVGNLTYIGEGENEIVAFDTGPGNALIDDWMFRHTGTPFDPGGETALKGELDYFILSRLLDTPYFDMAPPKSLDRDEFDVSPIDEMSVEDGAATLVAFTVQSLILSIDHLPNTPIEWVVSGGGRRNVAIMDGLRQALGAVPVRAVEKMGWHGDAIEAQAFGYLAIRCMRGLPISLPGTTGVPEPRTGGQLYRPLSNSFSEPDMGSSSGA